MQRNGYFLGVRGNDIVLRDLRRLAKERRNLGQRLIPGETVDQFGIRAQQLTIAIAHKQKAAIEREPLMDGLEVYAMHEAEDVGCHEQLFLPQTRYTKPLVPNGTSRTARSVPRR